MRSSRSVITIASQRSQRAAIAHLQRGLQQTVAWFVENWSKIEEAASFGPGMSSAVREMVVNQDKKENKTVAAE